MNDYELYIASRFGKTEPSDSAKRGIDYVIDSAGNIVNRYKDFYGGGFNRLTSNAVLGTPDVGEWTDSSITWGNDWTRNTNSKPIASINKLPEISFDNPLDSAGYSAMVDPWATTGNTVGRTNPPATNDLSGRVVEDGDYSIIQTSQGNFVRDRNGRMIPIDNDFTDPMRSAGTVAGNSVAILEPPPRTGIGSEDSTILEPVANGTEPEKKASGFRARVGNQIDRTKETAAKVWGKAGEVGNNLKSGGGKFGKAALVGGAIVGGTAAVGTGVYQMLGADGKELVQDILPGESDNARLAIERQRLREEADREWNRMLPYMPTPQQQMVMGREQAQWAAKNQLEYQSLAGLRNAQVGMMANRVSNQLAAMQVTNDTVANILNQRL
jgi:hypothetical protein